MMKGQQGIAMIFVLLFLAVGSLALVPTLRYASSTLKLVSVSRESAEVQYALDALTQQALWYLQYETQFEECDDPADGIDSFVYCVAKNSEWTLTTQPLPVGTPHTVVDQVNKQDASVTVSVPGALTADPEPTPTPGPGTCFYASVTRDTDPDTDGDQTWVQVGKPIEYTLHIQNCSTNTKRRLRNVGVIADPAMSCFPDPVEPSKICSTGGSLVTPPEEPVVTDCQNPPTTDEIGGRACEGKPPDSLLLAYPDDDVSYKEEGNPDVFMDPLEERTLTFQLTPNTFGVFYIDVTICFFDAEVPCKEDSNLGSGNVAPVVAGMFNIKGKGKGHAFGASSKLDDGGSDLISQQPE